MVTDATSLAQAVRHLLNQPGSSEELGRRAQAALIPHQGAARRQAELIAAGPEAMASVRPTGGLNRPKVPP